MCRNLATVFTMHDNVAVWCTGVRYMNKVNPRRARLVPEWATIFGQVYQLLHIH